MKMNTHRNIGAAVLLLGGLAGATSANAAIFLQVGGDKPRLRRLYPTNNRKTTRWAAMAGTAAAGVGEGDMDTCSGPRGPGPSERCGMRVSIALKVGIVAGLMALVLTASASAAIPGYHVVNGSIPTPNDSDPTNFLSVTCPVGEISLGAGARVAYGNPGISRFGEIVLNRIVPGVVDADQDGVTVRAFEDDDGTPGNWGLDARVVCADPLPGDDLDLRLRVADSSPLFRRIPSTEARCDVGKKLVGFGAEITDGSGPTANGNVIIDDITPNAGLTGVTVTAFEDTDGTTANWGLVVWFRCADATALPGIQRVSTTELNESFSYKSARATCPTGKKVLAAGGDLTGPGGVGGDTSGGFGSALMDRIHFTSGPFLREEVIVVARKPGGAPVSSETWFPHAYAICAPI